MLMKTKGSLRWLTFGESAHSPYKSILLRNMAWQDSHMHMLSLHECLVNGWGMCKVWCVILYLICALGNGMEARFHHWLKKKLLWLFISQFCEKSQNCEIKICNKLFHIIQWRKRAVSMLIKHLKKRITRCSWLNYCLFAFLFLFLITMIKLKNSYINNYIVIILKKIREGKYATFHDLFFGIFRKLQLYFSASTLLTLSPSNSSFAQSFFCPMPTNHIILKVF